MNPTPNPVPGADAVPVHQRSWGMSPTMPRFNSYGESSRITVTAEVPEPEASHRVDHLARHVEHRTEPDCFAALVAPKLPVDEEAALAKVGGDNDHRGPRHKQPRPAVAVIDTVGVDTQITRIAP